LIVAGSVSDRPSARITRLIPGRPLCTEAEWRNAPVIREDRCGHRLAEFDPAHQSIAATMRARAARTGAQREFAQQHWVTGLQHLRIGEPRVRHVRLHAARAVVSGTCARAAGDGLVVLARCCQT
jgi:hypothetical protein